MGFEAQEVWVRGIQPEVTREARVFSPHFLHKDIPPPLSS